jgi:dihydrofolate synthase/folylpolyglutamate synthase
VSSERPAVDFLFSLERFGMKFGLGNIARLCGALGHPETAFPSIIVGGTNGKGSVTAMVDAAVRAAGHRCARYTSPHLVRIEERFVIDGREVSPEQLEEAAAIVKRAAEELVARGALETLATFFECTTAGAFLLFAQAKVQLAVLEVGLGGRLDATNIVSPVAAAIVSIDLDHEAQLGNTIASVAAEKAGIIKPGIPVVCGPLPDDALAVVEAVCRERRATLIRTDLDVRLGARAEAIPLGLRGAHQRSNAAVALQLLDLIDEDATLGLPIGADAIRAGLSSASWPGRLETFQRGGCKVIVDAAHTPAGARALASYLRDSEPDGVTLVFGAMQDKAIAEMLAALAPSITSIVCTTAPNPRAACALSIAALARRVSAKIEAIDDPIEAVQHACGMGRTVVVAGSIFLIGPVRDWLARDILRSS